MTSGIPQGSGLRPLLFVMFINDLPNTVKCGVKLFADDTKVYVRSDILDKSESVPTFVYNRSKNINKDV